MDPDPSELVLDTDPGLSDLSRANIKRVMASARRLLRLVNDLLDLAKVGAGRMEVHLGRFDLAEMLEDVAADTRALLGGREVDVVVEADRNEVGAIVSDEVQVRKILVNLASNAARFTEHGRITLAASREGARVCLRVSDTGVGIPREAQSRIFEAFQQAHTQYASGGTGLGLSIVSKMSLLLGGEVRLHSEVGRGSIFEVLLPEPPQTSR